MIIPTPRFQPAPSVLLINIDAALTEVVRGMVAPMLILQVAHPQAARERMPVTRPYVVLARDPPPQGERELLGETATGLGIEVLVIGDTPDLERLRGALGRAIQAAQRRRGEIVR